MNLGIKYTGNDSNLDFYISNLNISKYSQYISIVLNNIVFTVLDIAFYFEFLYLKYSYKDKK